MMDLELDFGPEKQIVTTKGLRRVREASPTEGFWAAWRGNKEAIKNIGITVGKSDGQWVVTQWLSEGDDKPAPVPRSAYTLKNASGLLPYQIAHAASIVEVMLTHGVACDASDTGTGKTYTSIVVARELNLMPAIVCPKSVIPSWERVCKSLGVKPYFIANWEACKSEKFHHGRMEKDGKYKWDLGPQILLIFDEAHKAKGDWTINCHMVVAARWQRLKILLCSATLASNPNELRANGYALGLHHLKDFNHWRAELGCYQNQFNGWEVANATDAMRRLSSLLFPARGARMRIDDLGDQFPETQISAECYAIGDSEAKAMNKRYEELLKAIEKLKKEKSANFQAKALVLNLRYRQFAEAQKIKTLISLTEDFLENGQSVVVFTNFTETLFALAEKLDACVIHGAQTSEERQEAIDAFQADKKHVCIVNIAAGGAGVSLHDVNGKRPRVSLLCPTYRAIDLKQALGRVWRAGGRSKSIQRLVYAAKTIEEEVAWSVNRKISAINALNDGDLYEKNLFALMKD